MSSYITRKRIRDIIFATLEIVCYCFCGFYRNQVQGGKFNSHQQLQGLYMINTKPKPKKILGYQYTRSYRNRCDLIITIILPTKILLSETFAFACLGNFSITHAILNLMKIHCFVNPLQFSSKCPTKLFSAIEILQYL